MLCVNAASVAAPQSVERFSMALAASYCGPDISGGGLAKRVPEKIANNVLINLAACGRRAILVAQKFRPLHHPVIEQCISGAGIERNQRAIAAYLRDVRNAADIDDRQRPLRQLRRQGAMIGPAKRRAAASRDISGAQIVNHRAARCVRQKVAKSELDGQTGLGWCRTVWP